MNYLLVELLKQDEQVGLLEEIDKIAIAQNVLQQEEMWDCPKDILGDGSGVKTYEAINNGFIRFATICPGGKVIQFFAVENKNRLLKLVACFFKQLFVSRTRVE